MSNSSLYRPKRVLGNWKMHGNLVQNRDLIQGALSLLGSACGGVDVAVCVPFPYLSQVQQLAQGSALSWGAQDVSAHVQGAFTGEVSAVMLQEFGCRYVLVGHSERRSLHAETNDEVAAKAQQALVHGVTPVVCVGETLAQREAGQVFDVLASQLAPVFDLGKELVAKMVVAYEPVWAIGTGKTASPEQAQEVHAFLRESLRALGCEQVSILYGGSVKGANAADLFAMADIDGGLIGGAALNAEEFIQIVKASASSRSV